MHLSTGISFVRAQTPAATDRVHNSHVKVLIVEQVLDVCDPVLSCQASISSIFGNDMRGQSPCPCYDDAMKRCCSCACFDDDSKEQQAEVGNIYRLRQQKVARMICWSGQVFTAMLVQVVNFN